ncbi:MAG TPA: hydrogenase formation protein HypD [Polyangiaceae bacterium LLY-WYZ-15_(1-7)]|nr:hydrogenase formation protein HypD [Sandaracinus sp.]HJL05368.1 hydrogenase formation protein HypD [Polyangiaceae bacterium LLY-WYZ-15_(1-7)]HJL07257.1 hydrogenase formation protein HypD [Polyangiaceae bacterium LLY-WYZ-15_(1-7)]
MKYVAELRDPAAMRGLLDRIAARVTRPWTIMEICGGQTHAIVEHGLLDLLPPELHLVHGPGCPVCVTPVAVLERARRLALHPAVTLHTFGDMLRVPGAAGDLLDARAHGGDVRVVLSPLDAVRAAQAEPERTHALLAVGFETTAPTTALAVELAARLGLENLVVLASHVRVPPALAQLLGRRREDGAGGIDGLLAAGHVCTVEGFEGAYPELAARFGVPVVVTGFEPVDLLRGLLACVAQLEEGRAEVENAYARAVRPEGNPHARAAVERVFEIADVPWRGLGVLPAGGLALRPAFTRFDAAARFPDLAGPAEGPAEDPRCRAAEVLQGLLSPAACPELGRACTPEHPLGAPMVSTEGACAAYHRHRPVPLGRRP